MSIRLLKTEPTTWDDVEDQLREMGWSDEHLKNLASTIGKIATACGAKSVAPHYITENTEDERR